MNSALQLIDKYGMRPILWDAINQFKFLQNKKINVWDMTEDN